MYNPRRIIKTIVDKESWFEIGALWGTTTIVGIARFNGRPVGIIASNCEGNSVSSLNDRPFMKIVQGYITLDDHVTDLFLSK